MAEDAYLTTDQLLTLLKVDRSTVYRMIKAGHIPAVRVGRLWRFRKSAIDDWLKRQESTEFVGSTGSPKT